MNRISLFLFFIFLQISANASANMKLAIIVDKDGYTNIRSNKGSSFDIVGQVKTSDFIYCEKSTNDWYSVDALQWNRSGESIKGYIHKSRIRIIEDLDFSEQRKILSDIFIEYKKFNDDRNNFINSISTADKHFRNEKDSLKFMRFSENDFKFIDTKYDPILMIFPQYFCKTKDLETLDLLLKTIWSNRGSANEQPSYTLGECYLCNEKGILNLLSKITNKEKLSLVIGDITWGLCNHFGVDPESNKITNKEYSRLVKQLNAINK